MMNKSILFILLILLISMVAATDFKPQGDIVGRLSNVDGSPLYNIYAFGDINATEFFQNGTSIVALFVSIDDFNSLSNNVTLLDSRESTNNDTQASLISANAGDILLRLLISDQRYNDTAAISLKLDITDQRYNDTAAIALKLDITDQRYNDTVALNTQIAQQQADNLTQAGEISANTGSITSLDTRESNNNATQASQISNQITQQQTDNGTQATEIALKIDSSAESSLNVNSANFWDSLDTPLNISILNSITVTNLGVINAPAACPGGTVMTFTNMTSSTCVADQDTTYTNSSWDLSAIPTSANVSFLNFSLTEIDTIILKDGGKIISNATCVTILSPAGTGQVDVCD